MPNLDFIPTQQSSHLQNSYELQFQNDNRSVWERFQFCDTVGNETPSKIPLDIQECKKNFEITVDQLKHVCEKFTFIPKLSSQLTCHDDASQTEKLPLMYLTPLRVNPVHCTRICDKSMSKYNTENMTAVHPSELDKCISKLQHGGCVPKFIYSIFKDPKNFQAIEILKGSNQFQATKFDPNVGGMFIMPNPSYNDGKPIYDNLLQAKHTPDHKGLVLIAYFIPPNCFEDTSVFQKLFGKIDYKSTTHENETPNDYEKRTNYKIPLTVPQLTKKHLQLLKELKSTVLKHLKDTYGVTKKDTIVLYFHNLFYGVRTATVHLHIRVNHPLHEVESKTKMILLDNVLTILENVDDTLSEEKRKNMFFDYALKTKQGKILFAGSPTTIEVFDACKVEYKLIPNILKVSELVPSIKWLA